MKRDNINSYIDEWLSFEGNDSLSQAGYSPEVFIAIAQKYLKMQEALNQIDIWAYGQQDDVLLKITRKALSYDPLA